MNVLDTAARLTAREKEALRGWLDRKTAKEIALELGVSHYAVEKRLKAARLKLGVTSSLEAARLLAAQEGYGETASQATELVAGAKAGHHPVPAKHKLGVAAMLVISVAAVLMLAQQATSEAGGAIVNPAYNQRAPGEVVQVSVEQLEFVPASPERVEAFVRRNFEAWDKDGSGYVEQGEGPVGLAELRPDSPHRVGPDTVARHYAGEEAQRQYIAFTDKDGDERVSYEEFATPVRPQYLERGIPLLPADWSNPSAEAD